MNRYTIAIIGPFVVFYLLGAFVSLELNPLQWDDLGRATYATASLFFAFMSVTWAYATDFSA